MGWMQRARLPELLGDVSVMVLQDLLCCALDGLALAAALADVLLHARRKCELQPCKHMADTVKKPHHTGFHGMHI